MLESVRGWGPDLIEEEGQNWCGSSAWKSMADLGCGTSRLPDDCWVDIAVMLEQDDVLFFALACRLFKVAVKRAGRIVQTRRRALGTCVGRAKWALTFREDPVLSWVPGLLCSSSHSSPSQYSSIYIYGYCCCRGRPLGVPQVVAVCWL